MGTDDATDPYRPHKPVERAIAFDRYGPDVPASPIVISVPHAGREYSPTLLSAARVKPAMLRRLEDRHADLLADRAIRSGCSVIVARQPRAKVDLNRQEREIDPAMIAGLPEDHNLVGSAKLRGGLGLFPRRLQGVGDLWLAPIPWIEIQRRIERIHRPYHAAVERLMTSARDEHGHAILLDIHSMPPLSSAAGTPPPRIVLGDRFGRSAAGRLAETVASLCAARKLRVGQNHPYPGSYMIERHGKPDQGLHALQIEVDRTLYLDAAMEEPGPGLAAMQAFILEVVEALAAELPRASHALAAE